MSAAARGDDAGERLLPLLVTVAFLMESPDTTILSAGVPAIARRSTWRCLA